MSSVSAALRHHLCLFNEDRYHELHLHEGQTPFHHDHHDATGRLVGTFTGVIEGTHLVSGFRAPFGGMDLVRDWEPPEQVISLVEGALAALREEGITTVRVRCKPASWSSGEVVVQQALLQAGFAIERAELNFSIDLRHTTSPDAYRAGLKKEARRALAKAETFGLSFAPLESDEDWRRAFDLLARNRAGKGRPMNLTYEYVRRARETFPDRITMVGLGTNPLVAAALIYRVAPKKDVVVRWGDEIGHGLSGSPMYLLAANVVDQALAGGVATIDLGIATEAGVPNHGLVQFKRAIGAGGELRLDLVREIAG